MTTTANAMLENCCDPCPSCWDGCKNTCPVNIQSTNPDCLKVDTSECWVVKLEPTCPKPTYVKAWDNVTIKEVTPPDDCYMGWGDCWIKGWREVSSTDEKVKACPNDTTPWALSEKLQAWTNITITPIGCDWSTNSKLKISVSKAIPDEVEIPVVTVDDSGSKLISATVSWDDEHHIVITDKTATTYDNMCCVGFVSTQKYDIGINSWGNANNLTLERNWSIYTWNPNMAKSLWIKILENWYYRVFWQLTVQNNGWMDENTFFFNLWRWVLYINALDHPRPNLGREIILSTAKHWAYGRQVILRWKDDIDISDGWEISSWSGEGQTVSWFDWPWMTFNMDCYVDLYKWDVLTLGYRPQSDIPWARWNAWSFRFVWQDDSSTEYQALFWWTVLWVQMIAPKLFQSGAANEVYASIQ